MLFGNPSTFAIESDDAGSIGTWEFLHYRMWIGGAPVGDYEDRAIMGAVIAFHAELALDGQCRNHPAADRLTDSELWQEVWEPGYGAGGDSVEEVMRGSELIRRHHIDYVGMTAMDGFGVILVELPDGLERVVWRKRSSGAMGGIVLPPGTVESTAQLFLKWVCGLKPLPERKEVIDAARELGSRLLAMHSPKCRALGQAIADACADSSADRAQLPSLRTALLALHHARRIPRETRQEAYRLETEVTRLIAEEMP